VGRTEREGGGGGSQFSVKYGLLVDPLRVIVAVSAIPASFSRVRTLRMKPTVANCEEGLRSLAPPTVRIAFTGFLPSRVRVVFLVYRRNCSSACDDYTRLTCRVECYYKQRVFPLEISQKVCVFT
jgi:hypothetical protein